jgi:hypothetical protein
VEQVSRQADRQPDKAERRTSRRERVALAGRIVWRDARGTTRFATVRTRDLSDEGTFVECLSGAPIPLYRLVHLHLDHVPANPALPESFRRGKILSAVYRVGPSLPTTGAPEGYALRLLVDQRRQPAVVDEPVEMAAEAEIATEEMIA